MRSIGVAARGEHQDRRVASARASGGRPRGRRCRAASGRGRARRRPRAPSSASPARAVGGERDAKAGLAEIVGDHLGEAGVVFDQQDAVGHERHTNRDASRCQTAPRAASVDRSIFGAARASSTSAASASAWANRLLAASASAICSARNASIAARSTFWRSRSGALAGSRLLAHRQQVLDGALDDRPQLLLLLGRSIDLERRAGSTGRRGPRPRRIEPASEGPAAPDGRGRGRSRGHGRAERRAEALTERGGGEPRQRSYNAQGQGQG